MEKIKTVIANVYTGKTCTHWSITAEEYKTLLNGKNDDKFENGKDVVYTKLKGCDSQVVKQLKNSAVRYFYYEM